MRYANMIVYTPRFTTRRNTLIYKTTKMGLCTRPLYSFGCTRPREHPSRRRRPARVEMRSRRARRRNRHIRVPRQPRALKQPHHVPVGAPHGRHLAVRLVPHGAVQRRAQPQQPRHRLVHVCHLKRQKRRVPRRAVRLAVAQCSGKSWEARAAAASLSLSAPTRAPPYLSAAVSSSAAPLPMASRAYAAPSDSTRSPSPSR